MQTAIFSRITFMDTVAQRVRAALFVAAAVAVTAVNLLSGTATSAPIDSFDTTEIAFVVHDATVKPVAVRCPSIGC
ncbi:hypothetical protein JOF56_005317 [Kibdelosporangium banguiense]|uniref:Uncharacterized protein n=1 Tax=Kibdelosporangium banguiense TaxID=1365924 RepID=A0ABS4TKG8_9PSEU|nr:hypothetical protein [Kibdelosporangium banguiense]MBP2324932.1 hypothetical protein [Kibdelosporangium banguiense]